MTDEEFMALYEQLPAFEDFDDEFVTNEEQWTNQVAEYVDNHLTDFIKISQSIDQLKKNKKQHTWAYLLPFELISF